MSYRIRVVVEQLDGMVYVSPMVIEDVIPVRINFKGKRLAVFKKQTAHGIFYKEVKDFE